MKAGRHFSVSDRKVLGNPGGKLQRSGDWNGTHFTHWIWGLWPSAGLLLQRERERMMHAVLFLSSFLPFRTRLSAPCSSSSSFSPWLWFQRSQIPVSHFSTNTGPCTETSFCAGAQGCQLGLVLVYLMQMETGEDDRNCFLLERQIDSEAFICNSHNTDCLKPAYSTVLIPIICNVLNMSMELYYSTIVSIMVH